VAEVEWVEVRAPSIDEATSVALGELGLELADAEIEVLEQPVKGFLGLGGQDAVIRVKPKADRGGDRRRRGGRGGSGGDSKPRADAGRKQQGRGGRSGGKQPQPAASNQRQQDAGSKRRDRPKPEQSDDDRESMDVDTQAAELKGFLEGLLEAFGLEGEVSARVEDDVIYVEVTGEQTEALVGPKGSILQATLELCRTIIQRRTQGGAKIRLDIAGYNERRREALKIYARRLADKVLAEGGEVMLEPMNAAERKIVHDTVAEIDGVRSYSEGEEPRRSVVVAAED
jgi:spoIIIJ-associated protein